MFPPITPENQILLYVDKSGDVSVDVLVQDETIWLTQAQMTQLFQKDQSVIARHINNVFREKELPEKSNMQILHNTISKYRPVKIYSLDVIISVGYRVKSKQGTQFRIWANRILKEFLLKGYVVNQAKIQNKNYQDLKQLVQMVGRIFETQKIAHENYGETKSLFDVVVDYSHALDTLDKYDYKTLEIEQATYGEKFRANYKNAKEVVELLKQKFGGSPLFALEKDKSFHSSIGQMYQTFDGKELYPSIEEKAAILLYCIVKNHSFVDGNKRIGATLFLWFLDKNDALYSSERTKLIPDSTLVALTLMIAESRLEEKDMMLKLVVNLLGDNLANKSADRKN